MITVLSTLYLNMSFFCMPFLDIDHTLLKSYYVADFSLLMYFDILKKAQDIGLRF